MSSFSSPVFFLEDLTEEEEDEAFAGGLLAFAGGLLVFAGGDLVEVGVALGRGGDAGVTGSQASVVPQSCQPSEPRRAALDVEVGLWEESDCTGTVF